jgi:hypothetical protein
MLRVGERLVENPDKVDEIIGNKTWTEIRCSECNDIVNEAITLGVAEDKDETALICKDCITKAMIILHKDMMGYLP